MTAPTRTTLDPAVAALTSATGYLAEWHARRTSEHRSYVSGGHDCIDAIDAALRALHDARAALVSEIRHDQIERDVRVDQLLAEIRAERSARAYTREDPVTDDPLPPGVEGRPLGRHATNGDNGVR